MSGVSYDLDTSGGLMPLIRALIKPPDEDLNAPKPKKPQHPYYKRPGKGHNHDSCDACGEGGDLICCDRCPASFHLGCYDPPLEEDDIPAGLWLCKECLAADADKPASSRSSRAQSPADSKSDTEKKSRSLRNRTNSTKSRSKDSKDSKDANKEKTEEEIQEEEKDLSPMEALIKAAKIMNPRQFELPREMRIPCVFPGTEKDTTVISTDAWGCVPLPAQLCYVCQETCRRNVLIQCDYCQLLFHQDCLDPPLTALPTGRWMCPNHVEQYIDWKLVNSVSASERVALWEKFSGPVDQQQIKLDFIRRARKRAPLFRVKVPEEARSRVVVPDMVKYHYEHPAPLLPSRREYLRCSNVLKTLRLGKVYDESSDEEQKQEKHKICMNLTCPGYQGGVCPHTLKEEEKVRAARLLRRACGGAPLVQLCSRHHGYPLPSSPASPVSSGSSSSSWSDDEVDLRPVNNARRSRDPLMLALKSLDKRTRRKLAYAQLQKVGVGAAWGGGARAAAAVAKALAAKPTLPSQLLDRADRERISFRVWGSPGSPRSLPSPGSTPAAPREPLAPVRAALAPLNSMQLGGGWSGAAVRMRLSRLWVGSAGGCDVRLSRDCRRVSRTHAALFVDEVTRHFELINYSEYGTRVNGVLYTCDTSQCPGPVDRRRTGLDTMDLDEDSPVKALNELIKDKQPTIELRATSQACACDALAPVAPSGGAWEGSALVPHGALIQFGCLQYVFCIAD